MKQMILSHLHYNYSHTFHRDMNRMVCYRCCKSLIETKKISKSSRKIKQIENFRCTYQSPQMLKIAAFVQSDGRFIVCYDMQIYLCIHLVSQAKRGMYIQKTLKLKLSSPDHILSLQMHIQSSPQPVQ